MLAARPPGRKERLTHSHAEPNMSRDVIDQVRKPLGVGARCVSTLSLAPGGR